MQVSCKNMMVKHDCASELHGMGLRATPARLALVNLLEEADKPLDVASMIEFLQKKNIKADPATVFRIVNMFVGKGLIRQIQFNEGKFRYELAARGNHHHFICENCGAIEDIADCNIETLERTLQSKKGLLVKRHSLEFFGFCRACQGNKQ